MANVSVILQQDVPNLGHAGDVKQVSPGYLRNYLLPRGLAVEASQSNLKNLTSNKRIREAQAVRAKESADSLARHLQGTTIAIPVRLGEQGRIYGSVTSKDIVDALQQQASVTVDRHDIELKEPLKSIGVHSVPVKLGNGIEGHVQVELVPENQEAPVS
ncbi:MAG TPA: 50S ribosomal protein L9 [Chloroflexota bacterium]|nr:50S ribosomal protein L9 [Chloroflexota bacterium]